MKFLQGSAAARSRATTFEERMVYGTVLTVTFLREHSLLRKMLRTEPEAILPSLTIDAGAILDFATDYSLAWLRTELYGTAKTTPAQGRLRHFAERNTP